MFVFLALGSQRLHMQTSISACSAGMARTPHKVKHSPLSKLQTLLGSLAIICLSEQYKKKKEISKMLRLPTRLLLNQTWMGLWNLVAIIDDLELLDGDIVSGRGPVRTDVF